MSSENSFVGPKRRSIKFAISSKTTLHYTSTLIYHHGRLPLARRYNGKESYKAISPSCEQVSITFLSKMFTHCNAIPLLIAKVETRSFNQISFSKGAALIREKTIDCLH